MSVTFDIYYRSCLQIIVYTKKKWKTWFANNGVIYYTMHGSLVAFLK